MSCNQLAYNGQVYTVDELLDYISANPEEFTDITPSVIPSRADKVTLSQAEEFLKRNNIDIRELSKSSGLNGKAVISPLSSFVEYVTGQKETVLPEEAMHIAVSMLKQSNPKLYTDMLGKISQYNLYREVYQQYKDKYLTKEGKPDIRKIKEEAIAKLLVEFVINKNEGLNEHPENMLYTQSWWEKIVDWFKNLFSKGYNPFREAAEKAFDQEGGIQESTEMYQLSEEQKTKQLDLSRRLDEQLSKYGVNKIVKEATHPDEKDINKYVRTVEGKEQELARVTDIVDSKKDPKFKAKIANATKEEKAVYKLQAEWGTKFHADTEHIILNAALDNEGYLKPIEQIDLNGIVPSTNDDFFDAIQQFLLGTKEVPGYLYTQFPAGTLFKVEQQVFDPNRSFEGKKGLAGTIDLMGITPEGKVIIRDWKTMFLDLKTKDDVPYYKVKDTALQLGEYKKILSRAYDVDYSNISAQGQPVVYEGMIDKKKGTVNPTAIILPGDIRTETRKFVLPITTKDEKTGNEALDQLISGFYKMYDYLYRRSTDDKTFKNEQLNQITDTIRNLQIRQNFTPILQESTIFLKSADRLIQDITTQVKDKPVTGDDAVPVEKLRALIDNATNILYSIDKYASLSSIFESIYGNDTLSPEDQLTREALEKLTDTTVKKKAQVFQAFKTLMDYDAQTHNVIDLLRTEKTVEGFFNRSVAATSKLQTKAISLLYKLESDARTKRDKELQDDIVVLTPILKTYTDYAKGRGVATKDLLSLIQAKNDKGEVQNELLKKIKTEAWHSLENAVTTGDTQFIKDNIDVEKYKAHLQQVLQDREAVIDTSDYTNEEALEKKDWLRKQYDTSKDNALGWYQYDNMTAFLLEDKWYTDEYRAIKDIPALSDMYNWIENLNLEARKAGYHANNYGYSRRFLPWVLKRSSILSTDFFTNLFRIREDEEAYFGKVDPETQGLEKSIPHPFTRKFTPDENGKLPELSTDMGLNLTSYLKAVKNFKYLSGIEGEVKGIEILEKAKEHYEVDKNGYIIMKDDNNPLELPGNDSNYDLLKSQTDALLYGMRYSQDSGLGSPEATKVLESANKYMQMKVFAANLISPFINMSGGNFQGLINSGKLWGHKQWETNFIKSLKPDRLVGKDDLMMGLIDYFMLLTEDPNHKSMKQLSSQQLNKFSIQELMMKGMRSSDVVVQQATSRSMLENTALIEGKLVNVRQYISEQDRLTKYGLPEEERKRMEKTYKQRVQDFVKNDPRMVEKLAKFEDGYLTLPGFSRDSEELTRFRSKVHNQIKNITGGMTESEIADMDRNVMLRSMKMFKGWIAPMMDARIGGLKLNSASDEYEMGRTRIWLSILLKGGNNGYRKGSALGTIFSKGLIQGFKDLSDMTAANERGLQLLREYYERVKENYRKRTGQELKMTPEAFFDMTRQAITTQYKDIAMLIVLLSAYLGFSHIPPPDDPEEKNWRNTAVKMLDKLHDELSFYYNPLSFQQIANGSMIPSIGILTDGQRIITNISKELMGDDTDKIHTSKSILKAIPILNQATSTILPLMSPETAKDLGYRTNPNNNFTR